MCLVDSFNGNMELQYNNYAATPVVKTNLTPKLYDFSYYKDSIYYKPLSKDPIEPKVNLTPEQEKHLLDGISKSLEKDPRGMPLNQPGAKADAGKTLAWLCLSGFSKAIEKVAEVTTIGATKYSPNGWMEVPQGVSRYKEALTRHLLAYAQGDLYDDKDGGTGAAHMSQVCWNALAILELELREGVYNSQKKRS